MDSDDEQSTTHRAREEPPVTHTTPTPSMRSGSFFGGCSAPPPGSGTSEPARSASNSLFGGYMPPPSASGAGFDAPANGSVFGTPASGLVFDRCMEPATGLVVDAGRARDSSAPAHATAPTHPFESIHSLIDLRLNTLFQSLEKEPNSSMYTTRGDKLHFQVYTSTESRMGFTSLYGVHAHLVRRAFVDLHDIGHGLIVRVLVRKNPYNISVVAVLQTVEAFDRFLAETLPTL